ncbi:MAG: hypothetical protein JWM34_1526 [Ilumatobacteraceae bacterium]|nr:hypothetical protein [Ilumatobacteraceae bacterium]
MSGIRISCGLPPNRDIAAHAKLAEDLGFQRVWTYDSPSLYGDMWVALARAAEATSTIGLGTGVAVPSLRHVMVTASAIATIDELAPGRLVAAFGTGFTARRAMGVVPMKWADLSTYVAQLRALLAGEVVEVDGGACQMIHSDGFAPPRPIDVPLLMAPMGPKGYAAAHASADGVVLAMQPNEPLDPRWQIRALLTSGTILEPGDDHTSERVRAAIGPNYVTTYHGIWEFSPEAVDGMPGGQAWREGIEAERPDGQRHLAVHEGHFVAVSERDRPLLDLAGPALLNTGWTGDAAAFADRLRAAEAAGITEVVFALAGQDIGRELEALGGAYAAAQG